MFYFSYSIIISTNTLIITEYLNFNPLWFIGTHLSKSSYLRCCLMIHCVEYHCVLFIIPQAASYLWQKFSHQDIRWHLSHIFRSGYKYILRDRIGCFVFPKRTKNSSLKHLPRSWISHQNTIKLQYVPIQIVQKVIRYEFGLGRNGIYGVSECR
jgi:hypothetical protein